MGQIHVYTGDGKGKTTAAFGLTIRALGRGKRVAIIQFMKNRASGEIIALTDLEQLHDKLFIRSFGRDKFVQRGNIDQSDIKNAKLGVAEARKILKQKYDLVILDEINVALAFSLIKLTQVIKLLKDAPRKTEIVLTGRRAHLKIIEMADLVTEMRKIKHPYDRGVLAKEGLEY